MGGVSNFSHPPPFPPFPPTLVVPAALPERSAVPRRRPSAATVAPHCGEPATCRRLRRGGPRVLASHEDQDTARSTTKFSGGPQ